MRPDPLVSRWWQCCCRRADGPRKPSPPGERRPRPWSGSPSCDGAGWPGAAVLGAFFILSSALGRIAGRPGGCRRETPRASAGTPGRCWRTAAARRWARRSPAATRASPSGWSPAAWRRRVRTPGPPRSVRGARRRRACCLSGTRYAAGTNGGMTLLGTAGAVAGAAVISAVGAIHGRHAAAGAVGHRDRCGGHDARFGTRGHAAGTISLPGVRRSTASGACTGAAAGRRAPEVWHGSPTMA